MPLYATTNSRWKLSWFFRRRGEIPNENVLEMNKSPFHIISIISTEIKLRRYAITQLHFGTIAEKPSFCLLLMLIKTRNNIKTMVVSHNRSLLLLLEALGWDYCAIPSSTFVKVNGKTTQRCCDIEPTDMLLISSHGNLQHIINHPQA